MYILKAGVTRHMKVKLDNSLYAVTDIGRAIVHLTPIHAALKVEKVLLGNKIASALNPIYL